MSIAVAAHASIDTRDLNASVQFYEQLFGEPSVRHEDYARFELTEPPFVLSLVAAPQLGRRAGVGVDHMGIKLTELDSLEALATRLEAAGISIERETQVSCCYSEQTKFWVADPDGFLWEFYVRTADEAPQGRNRFRPSQALRSSGPASFTHTAEVGSLSVPHPDNSLDELILEGTLNAGLELEDLVFLLGDARRALRTGGTLRSHGLVANGPLPCGAKLPASAASAKTFPSEVEPVLALSNAGFHDVRVHTLRDLPSFMVGTVEVREILIEATAPAADPGQGYGPVTYLGPFASVTDDAGHTYNRGERIWVPEARRQALAAGPLAESFVVFEAPAPCVGEGCC